MKTQHNALSLYNLTLGYENKILLRNIHAEIPSGVMLAIVGPNGTGKTTLLKYLVGLIQPISGQTLLFNQPIESMRSHIAYVPQRSSIDWDFPLHVIDVVLMGCYQKLGWFKRPGAAEKLQALACLERVKMRDYANTPINELSGGQQQRIFIARALLQDASLYLLDEPFNGIDATTEHIILNLLQELRSQGKTILVVHHDLHTVQSYFDWALLLKTNSVSCGPIQTTFTKEQLIATFGSHAMFAQLTN